MDTFNQREPNGSKQFDVRTFIQKALPWLAAISLLADLITILQLVGWLMR